MRWLNPVELGAEEAHGLNGVRPQKLSPLIVRFNIYYTSKATIRDRISGRTNNSKVHAYICRLNRINGQTKFRKQTEYKLKIDVPLNLAKIIIIKTSRRKLSKYTNGLYTDISTRTIRHYIATIALKPYQVKPTRYKTLNINSKCSGKKEKSPQFSVNPRSRQKSPRGAGLDTQVNRDFPGKDRGRLEPQLGRLPGAQTTGVLTLGWEDPSFNSAPDLPDETRQGKNHKTNQKFKLTYYRIKLAYSINSCLKRLNRKELLGSSTKAYHLAKCLTKKIFYISVHKSSGRKYKVLKMKIKSRNNTSYLYKLESLDQKLSLITRTAFKARKFLGHIISRTCQSTACQETNNSSVSKCREDRIYDRLHICKTRRPPNGKYDRRLSKVKILALPARFNDRMKLSVIKLPNSQIESYYFLPKNKPQ